MTGEEIKAVLEDMDADVVREAFALLLAERENAPPAPDIPDFVNFAQAVLYLKKNYTFAELELFGTEADLVYVRAGGRRIQLTDLSVADAAPARRGEDSGDEGGWRDAAVRESPLADSRFSRLEL